MMDTFCKLGIAVRSVTVSVFVMASNFDVPRALIRSCCVCAPVGTATIASNKHTNTLSFLMSFSCLDYLVTDQFRVAADGVTPAAVGLQ